MGICAYLISILFKNFILSYFVTGMFFGILSKEIRWQYLTLTVLQKTFVGIRLLIRTPALDALVRTFIQPMKPLLLASQGKPVNLSIPEPVSQIASNLYGTLKTPIIYSIIMGIGLILMVLAIPIIIIEIILLGGGVIYISIMSKIFHPKINVYELFIQAAYNEELQIPFIEFIMPYTVQVMVLYSILGAIIGPLIANHLLDKMGFYERIPRFS